MPFFLFCCFAFCFIRLKLFITANSWSLVDCFSVNYIFELIKKKTLRMKSLVTQPCVDSSSETSWKSETEGLSIYISFLEDNGIVGIREEQEVSFSRSLASTWDIKGGRAAAVWEAAGVVAPQR